MNTEDYKLLEDFSSSFSDEYAECIYHLVRVGSSYQDFIRPTFKKALEKELDSILKDIKRTYTVEEREVTNRAGLS